MKVISDFKDVLGYGNYVRKGEDPQESSINYINALSLSLSFPLCLPLSS